MIRDCTEAFSCFKERIQRAHVKPTRRLDEAPLRVAAFACAAAYPENRCSETFGLGVTRLGNHLDSEKIRSRVLKCCPYESLYKNGHFYLFI